MSNMVKDLELKAGSLIVFSSGEYSDYGYQGSYVVLQDVSHEEINNIADEVRSTVKANEEINDSTGKWDLPTGCHGMFQDALIRRGFLACIDLREIHIGSYGELDLN